MSSSQELIKRRVLQKEERFDFFDWIDVFMHEYGMSFEEFKRLKIPTFFALMNSMHRRYDKQNKRLNKPKGKR